MVMSFSAANEGEGLEFTDRDERIVRVVPEKPIGKKGDHSVHWWHVKDAQSVNV